MNPCIRSLALACFTGAILAASLVHAADINAGKAKAEACIACHGAAGISAMPDTPTLAGQPDGFLQWQLVYFRGGTRKSPLMEPIAAGLSNEDVRNLAAYFASLKPPGPAKERDSQPQLFAAGEKLAQQNKCAVCHLPALDGQQAVARIAGQREDYLYKALRDYKSGVRTGGGVAAMPEVVAPLGDDDFKALAHYLARFESK